jgi:prepilin-type N-terminal cleavage/methylation domain-containing protein
MNKIFNKEGFTMIELLLAMAIFAIFITVIVGSFTTMVRYQREANEYRKFYSEAREIFDFVIATAREGQVVYPENQFFLGQVDALTFEMPDKNTVTIDFDQAQNKILVVKNLGLPDSNQYFLNQVLDVADFNFQVFPAQDPYTQAAINNAGSQFQPFVIINASFQGSDEVRAAEDFNLDLKTTISSRKKS